MTGTLPPLPYTEWRLYRLPDQYEEGWVSDQPAYTEDQMRAYAAAAVLAERERMLDILQDINQRLAAAIRSRT